MSNVKSAFEWNTKEPTVFAKGPAFNKYAKTGHIATESVERMREEGRDNSTIPGLSEKADAMVYLFKKRNVK
jgi:hypothetical protein